MVGQVNVQPDTVLAAAAELELLADRLAATAAASGPATHVVPSGAEEVSLMAANHFNHAAVTHDNATARGIVELHHAATTLRQQLAAFQAQDAARAATIGAIEVL